MSGPLQGGEAGRFGIPLVPANADADFPAAGLPGAKTQVAGRKVKFFVIERVVRNVHLAVEAEQAAVGIDDGGGVVIDARPRAFRKARR